jgi:hypothetical protein
MFSANHIMKIKFTYLAECGRIGIEMAGIDGRQ